MREHYGRLRRHREGSVIAQPDTGARLHSPHQSVRASGETDVIDSMIAMIEAAAARIRSNDVSAANAVLTNQGLALDTLFTRLTRDAVEDDIRGHEPMRLALRAQSQCRATLAYLVLSSTSAPASRAERSAKNSDGQTIENGNRTG